MHPVISFQGVHKSFKLQPHKSMASVLRSVFVRRTPAFLRAVQNVSFGVGEGEFIGVVGGNGAGKSTILKLIAGVLFPDKGIVVTRGRIAPFIELGVGFQPELTAADNIFLYGALLGLSRREVQHRFDAIVAFSDLATFLDQKVKQFSTGMQLRLAFAINAHVDADIFLVDEALAVGDEQFQRKCLAYMESLRAQGKTVVFVSHDIAAVEKYSTRVILMDKGTLVAVGNPHDMCSRYKKLVT